MKAKVGDYVRLLVPRSQYAGRELKYEVLKVVEVTKFDTEDYELSDGSFVNEMDLTLEDVLLASEVEVG